MRRYRRKEIMKIYIDFDDVLCETAEYFTKIAKKMFGIDVPYRFLSLPEGRSIPMNHRGNGLTNIIWKEFPCSV